jgi:hypothetical protein
MTVHTDVAVIVLENTTKTQLKWLCDELEAVLENTPEPLPQHIDSDIAWWGAFNLLCDLGVEGYEAP